VSSEKLEKIDLNSEYPCPCYRRGCLKPIILTEALGCDRCQQIFVVDDSGHKIEQLSVHYPYKQVWRWTGQQWSRDRTDWQERYLPLSLAIVALTLLSLLVAKHFILPWALFVLIFVTLPALLVWLAYRR
jgi:hypothetical protein